MPWHHVLWAPMTYPWSERTKLLGSRVAAAHLVVVCVVFWVVVCVVFCVVVASGHLAKVLTNNTYYFVESWISILPKWLTLEDCWTEDPKTSISTRVHTTLTLTAHGLEEHVRVSLIFAIIVTFMLFTVFTLVYVLYFKEFLIHDSCGFMILKKNWPNLLGLCRFPLNT